MKVEARACGFRESLQVERCRHMSFVWTLILREAGIAVNTKDRLLYWRDIARSELSQLGVDRVYKRFQGRANVFFVNVLVWLKPLALVVALKATEKGNRLAREARKAAVGFRLSAFGQDRLCCARHHQIPI